MNKSNYIVIQTTKAPYSTSSAVDALEAAMAATNVGVNVVFMFMDEGVLQLIASQQSMVISHKNIAKRLLALPLFDVEDIYAQSDAIKHFDINLSNLKLQVRRVDNKAISQICQQAHQVLVF